MTPLELAESLVTELDLESAMGLAPSRRLAALIAGLIGQAVEDATAHASGALADIAFATDLTLDGARAKARAAYEKLNPPGAAQ
jgi:hypothetical protein